MVGIVGPTAPHTHQLHSGHRFDSAEQDSTGNRLPTPRDDVEALVQSVYQVDVRVPNRAEHRPRPLRQTGARMAGQVVWTAVRLGLDDSSYRQAVVGAAAQPCAEQVARDLLCRPREELARQRSKFVIRCRLDDPWLEHEPWRPSRRPRGYRREG